MGTPDKYRVAVEDVVDDTVKMTINEAKRFGEEGIAFAKDVADFVDVVRVRLRGDNAAQALASIWRGAKMKLAAMADEAAKRYMGNILSIGIKFALGLVGHAMDEID